MPSIITFILLDFKIWQDSCIAHTVNDTIPINHFSTLLSHICLTSDIKLLRCIRTS